MISYTYSAVLFFTVIICFVASFDARIRFNKWFGPFLKAAILVAIPFITWDVIFTMKGVWWFNLDYTIGVVVAGLPVEEWMFFIFIPFSCVFTYFAVDKFFKLDWLSGFNNLVVFVTVIVCALIVLLHHDKIYTLVTGLATILTVLYFHFVARAEWITKASLVFAVLMLGFLPVNGVLTGMGLESPIVNYNPGDYLGVRIFTIPIEDAVYGYTQFLLVLGAFKYFQKRSGRPIAIA